MEKKEPSVLNIFFLISIGACLAIASVMIYFFSDYNALGGAKYIFMALHLIVVPLICLFMIGKGIAGIVHIKKQDREN